MHTPVIIFSPLRCKSLNDQSEIVNAKRLLEFLIKLSHKFTAVDSN